MTTQLKFYKNPTEAIKILLPGSALMIIAGLITIILTVTSFINGSFSNHITQLLQVINMNDVPSFWAVAVILTFFKIASIIIEAIIAKKCFTLYQTRQKQYSLRRFVLLSAAPNKNIDN